MQVLFLPEASDYIAGSFQESLSLAKPVEESSFVLGLQAGAREHDLAVNVGIHVPVPAQPGKLFNRTVWIQPDGSFLDCGTYDKLHLFDYADLRESAHTEAGSAIKAPFDTPVGRVGSLVCFDLRFPEPSLRLGHPPPALVARGFRPAQVITYPSAFTVPTGRAHWEVLLRARAIESQAWVVAAAQVGQHNERRTSYGHSMAVDPWGRVVCRLGGVGEDGTVEDGAAGALGLVDVDLDEWERVRRRMPLVRRT